MDNLNNFKKLDQINNNNNNSLETRHLLKVIIMAEHKVRCWLVIIVQLIQQTQLLLTVLPMVMVHIHNIKIILNFWITNQATIIRKRQTQTQLISHSNHRSYRQLVRGRKLKVKLSWDLTIRVLIMTKRKGDNRWVAQVFQTSNNTLINHTLSHQLRAVNQSL